MVGVSFEVRSYPYREMGDKAGNNLFVELLVKYDTAILWGHENSCKWAQVFILMTIKRMNPMKLKVNSRFWCLIRALRKFSRIAITVDLVWKIACAAGITTPTGIKVHPFHPHSPCTYPTSCNTIQTFLLIGQFSWLGCACFYVFYFFFFGSPYNYINFFFPSWHIVNHASFCDSSCCCENGK